MGDSILALSEASRRLVSAGNLVHSPAAGRTVLLAAVYETGLSVYLSMQALFLHQGQHLGSLPFSNFRNAGDYLFRFTKIASKHRIGLGEIGAFQEIFRLGMIHEKSLQPQILQDQIALVSLDFEHFLFLFEKATQFQNKVANIVGKGV